MTEIVRTINVDHFEFLKENLLLPIISFGILLVFHPSQILCDGVLATIWGRR